MGKRWVIVPPSDPEKTKQVMDEALKRPRWRIYGMEKSDKGSNVRAVPASSKRRPRLPHGRRKKKGQGNDRGGGSR